MLFFCPNAYRFCVNFESFPPFSGFLVDASSLKFSFRVWIDPLFSNVYPAYLVSRFSFCFKWSPSSELKPRILPSIFAFVSCFWKFPIPFLAPSIRMLLILSNFVFFTCFFCYNVFDSGKYFFVSFSCLEFSLSWQPQVLSLKDYLKGQGKLWPLHSLLSIHLLKWKNRYIKLLF